MNLGPLTAKQRAAWWALEDYSMVICEGAVRSGKSVGADHAFLDFALNGPEGNLALVGKTQGSVYRNVIEPLLRMDRCVRFNRGTRELRIGSRLVYSFGANDERAQDKLRGVTLVGAYVDEATTLPESFWAMLTTRLSLPGARLIATTNPDSPMHWLKLKYLDADLPHVAHFHFRLEDNPYNTPEYVAARKAEHTGLWYRRFIEGEWVAAEGAVYDMLEVTDGGAHVVRKLPELQALRLAIDYGTTNATVALLLGVSAENRLYVAREWRYDSHGRRPLTDAEFIERLDAWLAGGCDGFLVDEHGRGLPVWPEKVVVDPSAASFRAAWQRRFGRWPELADNAVIDGIRDTASLFARGQLVFHESCKDAIAEHVGYVWDAKAQEKGDDRPLKQADHSCDALRYGVRSYRTIWRHWPHTTLKEAA